MEADRGHFSLHGADRARQEVRQHSGITNPVKKYNTQALRHNTAGRMNKKDTENRQITKLFHCVAYSTAIGAQKPEQNRAR